MYIHSILIKDETLPNEGKYNMLLFNSVNKFLREEVFSEI